jgi:hypothetical protein
MHEKTGLMPGFFTSKIRPSLYPFPTQMNLNFLPVRAKLQL